MTYHDKSEAELEASIEEIRKMSREIEQLIDKKIDKYYVQMREKGPAWEPTTDQLIEGLKHEIELRNQLIKFQEISIRDVPLPHSDPGAGVRLRLKRKHLIRHSD